MAGNPRRNALSGVVPETCGLQRLDGGRTRARTWDPMIKSHLPSRVGARQIENSNQDMWYEAWYELFSLFGKCEKRPFLMVAGEGLEPPTPGL